MRKFFKKHKFLWSFLFPIMFLNIPQSFKAIQYIMEAATVGDNIEEKTNCFVPYAIILIMINVN